MGLFNSRNTRNERESQNDDYPDAADVAGEKAQENIQEEGRGLGRIMLDGFYNMKDFAVDAVTGKIERAQENKRLYQEEYRKAEKKAIKKQARDDAFGRGQDDNQDQGFLQNLAMGLNNTGNAFADAPREEEPRRERKGSRRRESEKSDDRRRRDDWGQLF